MQSSQTGKLRLLAIDASTAQERGATQTTYRLHTRIDFIALQLQQMLITNDKTAESMNNFDLHEGDIVLLDRGVDIILHYNPQGLCRHEKDNLTSKINWVDRLSKHKTHQSFQVHLLHQGKAISYWLHAHVLSPEQTAAARRKVKAERPRMSSYYWQAGCWY